VEIAYTSLVHISSNINQHKWVYVTAKISKQCCIGKTWKSNKIWRFLRNQDEFGTNCGAVDKHTKISVKISAENRILADIQRVKY